MSFNSEIWEPFDFLSEESRYVRVGPLKIWMERHSDEWFLASDYQDDETGHLNVLKDEDGFTEKPEDLVWRRIVASTDTSTAVLLPVMNEKPIVVGADTPLTILPGNEALIFINVPASIRLLAGTRRQSVIYELPTVMLSNTWMGSPASGELCLSLKTSAVRSKDLLNDKPNRVGCPVLIKNLSDNPLELQKICVHTENLGIYLGNIRLWTNRVTINYFGTEKNSEIRRGKGGPKMEENEKLLSPPRTPAKDSFLGKSINLFRFLTE